jgi:hypothetical protein
MKNCKEYIVHELKRDEDHLYEKMKTQTKRKCKLERRV